MAAADPNNVWVRRSAKHGLSATKTAPIGKSPSGPLYPASSNRGSSQSASKSFGLGSGAFASFGSSANPAPPQARENQPTQDQGQPKPVKLLTRKSESDVLSKGQAPPKLAKHHDHDDDDDDGQVEVQPSTGIDTTVPWTLRQHWAIWYRPPAPKNSDYEKSLQPICHIGSGQDFWKVYVHLKRPSKLPVVSDYHFFRDGVRPVWEDEANKYGGKWILRLKKGVADRYWENILLALIGNDYNGFTDDVSGVVLSVRSVEDVLSIWTNTNDGKACRVRDALQSCLDLPPDTAVVWKSHDDSIAQRTRGHRPNATPKPGSTTAAPIS